MDLQNLIKITVEEALHTDIKEKISSELENYAKKRKNEVLKMEKLYKIINEIGLELRNIKEYFKMFSRQNAVNTCANKEKNNRYIFLDWQKAFETINFPMSMETLLKTQNDKLMISLVKHTNKCKIKI